MALQLELKLVFELLRKCGLIWPKKNICFRIKYLNEHVLTP